MSKKGVPRFMVDSEIGYCTPVTVYTAKKDGSFVARCHSVPGFVLSGVDFNDTVAKAQQAYRLFLQSAIWN